MGRIRILSDNVANKIAAGEVVERPASVAKELIENSLDAGATELRVDVEGGGRSLLRVSDNGCGLLRDDALLAFERHATSKLSNVDELESISTLGFRGEALPSIASVSRLTLETRTDDEPTATRVEIAGGKILRCDETAHVRGTTITVRDLFFNVPARRKFLRSDATELAHIASLVTHYSLAHPDKSFELNHGTRELLRVAPVATSRERVFEVFGAEALDELIELPVFSAQQGRFCLSGFISRPQIQKTNRNSIFLFVNRRLIRDKLLMHAISSAYHNLMPPACYPFALLFVDCDPGEVDVNVHPSKTEVRFRSASFVHDFVRDTLRATLVEQRPVAEAPPPSPLPLDTPPQPAAGLPFSEFSQQIENFRFDALSEPRSVLPEPRSVLPDAPPELRLKVPETHGGWPEGVTLDVTPGMASLADLRVLGQLHASFILAVGPDGLWIIDQHVAHERILFEQNLRAQAAGKVEQQRLLLPVVLRLSGAQQIEFEAIADELARSGFECEPFGRSTIAVKAAPAGLSQTDLEKVLFEILEIREGEFRAASISDLRRGIAASLACRAAIKINMPLDLTRMEWLLSELGRTECPMSCPHGRPVALRYSTREILRSFHRI
jgi:DNA mismatch repair protein MutL